MLLNLDGLTVVGTKTEGDDTCMAAFDGFAYHKTFSSGSVNYGIDISKLLALTDLDSD